MNAQHIDTSAVTPAQLDACTRISDYAKHQIFYLVRNSRDLTNDQGEIIEYKVAYNRELKALQCLPFSGPACPASENGRVCWHIKASLKSAELHRIALKAEQEATLQEIEVNGLGDVILPYTVMTDPTSSSLDGLTWELAPSGRSVPMR